MMMQGVEGPSLESLSGELLEKIALMGGIRVYRTMIYAIPKLAFRDGVSYRAQKRFTTKRTYAYGLQVWRMNNKLHNVDGPALIFSSGHKEYWFNHRRHRVGGPAITFPDGREEWWFNGQLQKLPPHAREGPTKRRKRT